MRRSAPWGLLLLFLACWITLAVLWPRRYAPPSDVRSFDAFLEHFGPPASLQRFDDDHLIATLPVSRLYLLVVLPSARPAYVFDRSGRLIDDSTDPGDDPHFQDRWPIGNRPELSIEQARRWIRRR